MIKNIILLAIILSFLDFVYLYSMSDFVGKMINNIQKTKIQLNYFGVLACYIFIVFGLYYFIIFKNKSLLDAFLLGVFSYGIYETTNYSTIKNWDFRFVLIDTLWGGILFSLSIYLYRIISNYFKLF